MAETDYRALISKIQLGLARVSNITGDHLATVKKHEAAIKELQSLVDFHKREIPKTQKNYETTGKKSIQALEPLANKQDELAAAKREKPVDKEKVKKLEAEIRQGGKKLVTHMNQWSALQIELDDIRESIKTDFKKLA